MTLARLDIRYTFQLGETKKRLVDYPNLWGYARDLWQIPAFRNNTFFADFANPEVNDHGAYRASYNYRFLRQIDFEGLWGQPADRARLSEDPAHKFLAETDGGSARTEDGFAGYPLTDEQKKVFRRDAEAYEKIHSVSSWNIEKVEGDAVKDPADIPRIPDTREKQREEILSEIARIPEKPLLDYVSAGADPKESGQADGRTESDRVSVYIKDAVTDTAWKLLTSVKLQDFEDAYQVFYAALDRLENRLKDRRFLLGDFVSVVDIDLFVTLVRFDSLISRQIGPTKHRLVDYKNLWGYARDLYQIPQFRKTVHWSELIASVNLADEKSNYSMNPFYDSVLPKTDLDAVWETETERAYLSSDPTHVFFETDNRRFDR